MSYLQGPIYSFNPAPGDSPCQNGSISLLDNCIHNSIIITIIIQGTELSLASLSYLTALLSSLPFTIHIYHISDPQLSAFSTSCSQPRSLDMV